MTAYTIPGTSVAVTPFYDRSQPLFCLTNFSQHSININGIEYPTTEHYFQAHKFADKQGFLNAVNARGNRASDALAVARERTAGWSAQDWQQWDARKETIMMQALRAKLGKFPNIATELRNTGNSCLVEDTAERNETIWGWGNDGNGHNKLGKLWMRLRNELFQQQGQNQLVVDPDRLYAEVQQARRALGQRPQLLQNWPDARVINTRTPQPSTNDTIFRLANDLKSQMQSGQFAETTSQRGVAVRYGRDPSGHFYLQGTDRHGAPIKVVVQNNSLYENNRKVRESGWANWALPIIRQALNTRTPRQPSTTPGILKAPYKENPSNLPAKASRLNIALKALLVGSTFVALALIMKVTLAFVLCAGLFGTVCGAWYFNKAAETAPSHQPPTTQDTSSTKHDVDALTKQNSFLPHTTAKSDKKIEKNNPIAKPSLRRMAKP